VEDIYDFGRKPIWKIYFAPEYRLLKIEKFLILSPIDFTASNDKYYIQRSFGS
jgi:hypothetical protein